MPFVRFIVGRPDTLATVLQAIHSIPLSSSLSMVDRGAGVADHEPKYSGSDLAYIIRTSGTTRGGHGIMVRVPHLCISTNVSEIRDRFEIAPMVASKRSVFLLVTAPTFDPSLIEMLLPLTTGNTLAIIATSLDSQSPLHDYSNSMLLSCISAAGVTHLMTTPLLFLRFSKTEMHDILMGLTPIRHIVLGGEAFPASICRTRDRLRPTARAHITLWNIYGTTECSVWASLTPVVDAASASSIHLSLAETTMSVVSASTQEHDSGDQLGELWIGGRKRICFVGDETDSPEMRPTGDLVEISKDTRRICIVGRSNRQIKRRGYRIHLDTVAEIVRLSDHVVHAE
eukprot:jgi/Hompol1/6050/HPOL_000262-RA